MNGGGDSMPWTVNDYPRSWKNFETLKRQKAIDIGNAMLKNGFDEEKAIPIATKQAEQWYDNATQQDLEKLKHHNITIHQQDESANPDLNKRDVHVYYEDQSWKIKTDCATKASNSFAKKEDALKRARNIAANRNTEVIEHTKTTN